MTTHPESAGTAPPSKRGRLWLGAFIALALSAVILAPTALSSRDLYRWAVSPTGLDLEPGWALVVFVALDLAAVVCVGMVVMATMRGESGGIFHVLTWLFAFGSAYANREHALSTTAAGDDWFFPAASIMGPFLLEAVLHRLRKWVKVGTGTAIAARPSFGGRWLPGVAFKETLSAWAASRREDIASPADAIAHVRERRALDGMSDVDAIRYAWSALGTWDEYSARVWLQARGRTVSQAAIDEATGDRPRTPLTATQVRPALPPAPPEDDPDGLPVPVESDPLAVDRATLAALTSKRDKIRHAFAALGSYEVPQAVAWLEERDVIVSRGDAYAVRKSDQDKTRATLRAIPGERA